MLRVITIPNITDSLVSKPFVSATKTKGLFARPISELFNDITIAKHFTLNTLEGPQAVDINKMFCMGTAKSDPWQLPAAQVIKNYDLESVTLDGWFYFLPKATSEIQCYQTTDEDVAGFESKSFHIFAANGTEVYPDGVTKKYMQTGTVGDYILKNETEFWIVRKEIFNTTYEIRA